jgi:hypothetical protein
MPNGAISQEEADQEQIIDEPVSCDSIQIELNFQVFPEAVGA